MHDADFETAETFLIKHLPIRMYGAIIRSRLRYCQAVFMGLTTRESFRDSKKVVPELYVTLTLPVWTFLCLRQGVGRYSTRSGKK